MLDAEARDADEADVLIAPIVGLQMSLPRLQLPHGVRIVRADAIEAPVEAMRSEGMGRAAWEPQFLAVAEQDEGAESAAAALRQLRELISVMRLFKGGGIGLGPYAFAPTGEGRWRRIATGAPADPPRRLPAERGRGRASSPSFAGALEARPDPDGALAWAVARFEMGCERETALEGLSDHLLALRAVLEGHGPVGASLPMRAAALIADDDRCDRIEARERVEERARAGARADERRARRSGASSSPAWIEEGVRRLLREAALGELGTDLSTAADETLIADRPRRRRRRDRRSRSPSTTVRIEDRSPRPRTMPSPEPSEDRDRAPSRSARADPDARVDRAPRRTTWTQETRIMEPIPAEDEIRITADRLARARSPVERAATARVARRRRAATSSTASGSTPRASATSSRCPRTPTGRSASSSTTTTAATPASRQRGRAAASAVALLAAGEQVAVDLGQAGEVVDVLVQVGDADHALGCAAPRARCSMLRGVALGQRLVVGEVLGDPLGQVLVAELLARSAGRSSPSPRRSLGRVVDLVDDHAAEGQLRLDQLAVEVDGLVDRLALRAADDEEAGARGRRAAR